MQINRINSTTAFKSQYLVDGASAVSRGQVLVLGGLMCSHWIMNPRNTFNKAKYTNVYGEIKLDVNEVKAPAVENILKTNNITFKKVDPNNNNGSYSTLV